MPACGTLGLILLTAAGAYAQTVPVQRPSRALFGNTTGDTEQSLWLRLSFGGGYDDNILAPDTASIPTESQSRAGAIGQGAAHLGYNLAAGRFTLAGSLGTGADYYAELRKPLILRHTASATATVDLAERTRLLASQTLTYDPRYRLAVFPEVFGPLPGAPVAADDALDILLTKHLTSMSAVELSQQISGRLSLGASYGYNRSQASAGSDLPELSVHTYGGRLGLSLARGLDLRAGYGLSEGRHVTAGDDQRTRTDHVDAGIDFNRAISLSRKTHLAFTTGSSAVKSGSERRFRLTGTARLTREIGRTWYAGIAFSRDVGYLNVFRDPIFSDSAQITVGGSINRRVQFTSAAGGAHGDIGLGADSTDFSTYYGRSGLRFGFTRHLGASIEYAYYRHLFAGGGPLPLGVAPRTDRQVVRAGLDVWLPLLQRTRRPDAPR